MQNFCIAYRGILSKHEIYATETTGRLVEEVTNLTVHKYLAGHLGGMQQLGAQIAQNDIDALIVYAMQGSDVDTVIVNGETLTANTTYTTNIIDGKPQE